MMRTLLSVLIFLWAVPALGQKSVPAWPAGLDTVRYPIYHKVEPMSVTKIAELGLRPVRLDTAVVVWNWYEARKRFLPDTLQKGVIVAVDSTGKLVYKVDCTNRLASFPLGASVLPMIGSPTGSVTSDSTVAPLVASTEKGFAGRFLEGMKSLLRGLAWFLLGLLALAALAAVIMLLLYWLAELDNWMQRRRARRLSGNPPAPTPAPVPVPLSSSATPSSTAPVLPNTTPPASPSATTTEVPVATPATRRFISYFPGDDHRIRFSGVRNVRFEEEGGVTTIRFQNA